MQRMQKTAAAAIARETAFDAGLQSARNFFALLADFMYGTPERAKMTCLFAFGLASLGALLSSAASALQACPA